MNNAPASSSECTSSECKARRTTAEEEASRVRQELSRSLDRVRDLERSLAATTAVSNKAPPQPSKTAPSKGQPRRRKAGGGDAGARGTSDESAERERERQTQRASPAHSEATSSGGSTTDNAVPPDSRLQGSSMPVADESKAALNELRQRLEFMQLQHNAEKSRVYELISALTEKNAFIDRLHRMHSITYSNYVRDLIICVLSLCSYRIYFINILLTVVISEEKCTLEATVTQLRERPPETQFSKFSQQQAPTQAPSPSTNQTYNYAGITGGSLAMPPPFLVGTATAPMQSDLGYDPTRSGPLMGSPLQPSVDSALVNRMFLAGIAAPPQYYAPGSSSQHLPFTSSSAPFSSPMSQVASCGDPLFSGLYNSIPSDAMGCGPLIGQNASLDSLGSLTSLLNAHQMGAANMLAPNVTNWQTHGDPTLSMSQAHALPRSFDDSRAMAAIAGANDAGLKPNE